MFEVKDDLYLNGEKFKMISGAIHYFRIVPEYWQDRLEKLQAMGCNTVETYIPWNGHEPEKGKYNFDGNYDLEKFIQLATNLGLYIILRPSPYICAEWEFGGLPYWLLKDKNIQVRTTNPLFITHLKEYYQVLIPKLIKYQITNGGNVIMMQIENEYGYFSDDKQYLQLIKNEMVNLGVDVPLCTSDGPWNEAYLAGSIDGILPTLNFGSKAKLHIASFKERNPHLPFICMEYWLGWFDALGEAHHLRDPKECAQQFDDILKEGHVNIYMFHGGTNFGYYNGANDHGAYSPLVTSYDYDALLTENGQPTEKYYLFQKVISKYVQIPKINLSQEIITGQYSTLKVKAVYDAFANLDAIATKVETIYPQTFELLDFPFGYVYYQTETLAINSSAKLIKAADRAIFYRNNSHKLATLENEHIESEVAISNQSAKATIGVLVENQGRVNFHHQLDQQRKGITSGMTVNNRIKTGFAHHLIDFHHLDRIKLTELNEETPTISHFELQIDTIFDTYVDVSKFGHGVLLLNGEVLGRFDSRGPQTRLYIPAPKLKIGINNIHIFEVDGKRSPTLSFATNQNWLKTITHDAVEN